jgi:hypothetical protein
MQSMLFIVHRRIREEQNNLHSPLPNSGLQKSEKNITGNTPSEM